MPILSVRSALPGHRYPQQQLTDAFAGRSSPSGGLDEALLRRLHRNAGVETRHVVLAARRSTPGSATSGTPTTSSSSTPSSSGSRALVDALKAAGLTPSDVDLVVSATVTGLAVPSLDARIAGPGRAAAGREADAAGRAGLRGRGGRHRPRPRLPPGPSRRRRRARRRRAVLADRAARRRLDAEPRRQRPVRRRRRRRRGGRSQRRTGRPGPVDVLDTRSHLYPDTERTMGFDVTARACASCSTPRCRRWSSATCARTSTSSSPTTA